MTADEEAAGLEGARVPREPDDDELRKEARARALKRVALVAGVAALVLLLSVQTTTLLVMRSVQKSNKPTLNSAAAAAKEAKSGTDTIKDCTTPGGECFERAQRQTSGAVAGINTITVRAAACLTVILKRVPDGQRVNVDDIADEIKRCIQSTSATVKPTQVVPAPKPTTRPTTVPTRRPAKPKKHHHPKGTGTPGVPTPSPSTGPGLVNPQVLCDLLFLVPCPLH